MSGQLFFEVPKDQKVMVLLVHAIPADWRWMNGTLQAPQTLTSLGKTAYRTGYSVNSLRAIRPNIIGARRSDSPEFRYEPDLYAIMIQRKHPEFVEFDCTEGDFIQTGKRIVKGFLNLGYRGALRWVHSCKRDVMHNNPARCHISFAPWNAGRIDPLESGLQPARIRIEWNSEYGGTEAHVEPIVSVCRTLELPQYTPVQSTEKTIV